MSVKVTEFVELNLQDHIDCITVFYGDSKAVRSNVPYINHIHEGLRILDLIGASMYAKCAYCLHPIFQSDEELKWYFTTNSKGSQLVQRYNIPNETIVLAMEYRRSANSYLSKDNKSSLRLSPIHAVKEMLIADKIQNRKDFEQHHLGRHERSEILLDYFEHWLWILGISEERYQELAKLIT